MSRHRRPRNRTVGRLVVVGALLGAGVLTTGAFVSGADAPGTVRLNGNYVCVPVTPTPTVPVTTPPATVPVTTPPATPTPTVTASDPSGQNMPTGDLPGWHQTFTDDFTTPAAQGQFLNKYPGWSAYPTSYHDTSGAGEYNPQYLSVNGGLLDIHLSTVNGQPMVNAPEPMNEAHQTYGRYTVRFRATANGNGYKTAWLLWSDAKQWPAGGEIDFPEGDLNGTMWGFAHYANPGGGQDVFDVGASYSAWHTATTEWSPGKVSFILDGKVVGTSTTQVPSGPMRFVLQTETDGGKPASGVVADVQIDWYAQYTWAG